VDTAGIIFSKSREQKVILTFEDAIQIAKYKVEEGKGAKTDFDTLFSELDGLAGKLADSILLDGMKRVPSSKNEKKKKKKGV